jgi:hypothetical protein
MAKDEFIGIRASKEFKTYLQKQAKKKGMSLSQYLEYSFEEKFIATKDHVQFWIDEAKEKNPEFWGKADQSQITKEFEKDIPILVTDFINPSAGSPYQLPYHMLSILSYLLSSSINNIDSMQKDYHGRTSLLFLSMARTIGANLNKLKSDDIEEKKEIISEMKNLIEMFGFYFTSLAFNKDSFVMIKEGLDKTEKMLLNEIK